MKNEDTITPRYVFLADMRESSQRHPEESKLNWVMRWRRGAEKEKREGAKESRDDSPKRLHLYREGRWKPSPWEGGV